MQRKAVFLDKDGTLIQDVPYNVDPNKIRFYPGSAEGLKKLKAAGYVFLIVSNQPGVANNCFPEAALQAVSLELHRYFEMLDIPLEDFYWCPHDPDGILKEFSRVCECRKPAAGLFLKAAREHHLNLSSSWCIGDILDDIEAGHRAGLRCILLDRGNETLWHLPEIRTPEHSVLTINEAADWILQEDAKSKTPFSGAIAV